MVIKINALSSIPIYTQLRDQVVLGIASNRLEPGEALPSARRLSADLGINLHTVNKAYALLIDEGYIAVDRRKGTFVSKPQKNEGEINSLLSDKLVMTAAEAICHSVSEKDFIEICSKNYNKALNKMKHREDL